MEGKSMIDTYIMKKVEESIETISTMCKDTNCSKCKYFNCEKYLDGCYLKNHLPCDWRKEKIND